MLWPQVTADLTPLSRSKVQVKFDRFGLLGLISFKAPDTAVGGCHVATAAALAGLLASGAHLALVRACVHAPMLRCVHAESHLSCPAGELDVTYLDEDLRVSRGDKGNVFVLRMKDSIATVDP